METVKTQVYLTPEQHEALRRLAFERHSSLAELVRQAVDKYLEEEKAMKTHMAFPQALGFEDYEELLLRSTRTHDEGDVSWFVTALPDGTFAAWDDSELAVDRITRHNSYEDALASQSTSCLYCSADIPVTVADEAPAEDDDDAWERVAKHHIAGCEWIETRAHRR